MEYSRCTPKVAVVSLIIIYTLVSYAVSNCINGKKNGERWDIGTCQKCSCINNKISCIPFCDGYRQHPALFHESKVEPSKIKRKKKYCIHENLEYQHNDSWHETGTHASLLDETKECMQCHCHRKIVTCTIRFCYPVTCRNPIRQNGSCCLSCPHEKEKEKKNILAQSKGCFQSGSIFSDGSTWRMYIPVQRSLGRCLQCSCKSNKKNLSVFNHVCKQIKCPRLTCGKLIGKPGQCCGVCKDGTKTISSTKGIATSGINTNFMFGLLEENDEKDLEDSDNDDSININGNEMFKQPIYKSEQNKNPNSKDCYRFGADIYKNGEHFIPKIAKCLRCKCQDSNIQCEKVICDLNYACRKPIKRKGLCCKVCPDISDDAARMIEDKHVTRIENKHNINGCGKSNYDKIQVYQFFPQHDAANALQSFFFFDRSYQTTKHQSELHSVELVRNKVLINVTLIQGNNQGLTNSWKHIGAFKDKILKRIYRQEEELKKTTDIANIIRKIDSLRKLIIEKAGRRRTCKSPVTLSSDMGDVLKTLQEVNLANKQK